MKVSGQMIKRGAGLQMWFSKSHYTLKIRGAKSKYLGRVKNGKQKAMDISCNFCKPTDLCDKDFSHEHHDLIVEKDDPGII